MHVPHQDAHRLRPPPMIRKGSAQFLTVCTGCKLCRPSETYVHAGCDASVDCSGSAGLLLHRLFGTLCLVFDVLSRGLALLLETLDARLSGALHGLSSLLSGRLQAFAHIPRHLGGLLLDRLQILLKLGYRLPLLLAGRNQGGHQHPKAERDYPGGQRIALRLPLHCRRCFSDGLTGLVRLVADNILSRGRLVPHRGAAVVLIVRTHHAVLDVADGILDLVDLAPCDALRLDTLGKVVDVVAQGRARPFDICPDLIRVVAGRHWFLSSCPLSAFGTWRTVSVVCGSPLTFFICAR